MNFKVGTWDLTATAATGSGVGNYTITYAPLAGGLVVNKLAIRW
ncbi:MAG: hypothetical protein U0792_01075 [Gemmataceae bacterium]